MKLTSKEYDVVVIGAGPGGLPAAIAAAREGAKVLLIERNGFVGGNLAMGLPLLGYLDKDGNKVVEGIAQEFIDELRKVNASSDHYWCPLHNSVTIYDPEIFKVVALNMCLDAGVEVLFHAVVTDTNVENGELKSITVFGKGHKIEVSAKVFIDATGDGDVAYMAGCRFEVGQKGSGTVQPATLMMTLGGVDVEKVIDFVEKNPEQMELSESMQIYPGYDASYFRSNPNYHVLVGLRKLFAKYREEGILPVNRDTMIYIQSLNPGEVHINCTRHQGTDGSDMYSVTKSTIEGYQQNFALVDFLRQYVPGFENCRIECIYPFLGIRETRRFDGLGRLTEDMVCEGRIDDDTIGLGSYIIDIHEGNGLSTTIRKVRPYGLPYLMTCSKDISNLMFAGRCASMDSVSLSSVRVMPSLMAMGEGAGVGAALAVRKNCKPGDVSVSEVRDILSKNGVQLAPLPDAKEMYPYVAPKLG